MTGFLLAGVLPLPLGPSNSTAEVADFYGSGVRVPVGLVISSVGMSFVIPLVAGIGYVMFASRRTSPVYALAQLVTGAVTAVCLLVPTLIMAIAGFRPDRDPQITMAINDLAWLLFLTPIGPFIIQNLAIAAGILTNPHSVFPRWLGFANLCIGFTFSFDILAFAFKTGPFAWNGFLIFWLALTTYAIWLLIMAWALRRAALDSRVILDDQTDPVNDWVGAGK